MNEQAVLLIDREGVIRYWSPGAEALLGHDAAEATGQTVEILIPEFFKEQHWAGFRAAMDSGALRENRDQFVVPAQAQDGTVLPVVTSLALVRDPFGTAVGAIAVMQP